jgi:hypothetical protein
LDEDLVVFELDVLFLLTLCLLVLDILGAAITVFGALLAVLLGAVGGLLLADILAYSDDLYLI